MQDGKVRDAYSDLLENREYTPETIEQWDKKAVDWIDKLGGILPAIDALASGMRHKDRHVNTLIVRHILESDIANAMPSDDLIKLEDFNTDPIQAKQVINAFIGEIVIKKDLECQIYPAKSSPNIQKWLRQLDSNQRPSG